MTASIFRNPEADEEFTQIGFVPGKGPQSSPAFVVTRDMIRAACRIERRYYRSYSESFRRMKARLLSLRMPVSRLVIVRGQAETYATAYLDPERILEKRAGETFTNYDWCSGARLVSEAALSILADQRKLSLSDSWTLLAMIMPRPTDLPDAQRRRVGTRILRDVSRWLMPEAAR